MAYSGTHILNPPNLKMHPFRSALMPIVLAIGFAYSSPASSADNSNQNTIRFGMAAAEYPPYLIYKDESLRGIVGDTFFKISESMGFKINLTVLPRKRLQYKIKNGEIDAYATALEWVKYTSDHIWTDGIIRVSDNVIMVKDHRTSITNARKLAGKNIAVMSGYKYPSLDKMIKDGTVKAIQANRFESLLRMVEFLRVDYGILDKNVANWTIQKQNLIFKKPLHIATPGFDAVEFRIVMFSQKWAPVVQKFNKALAKFKSSNGWSKLLDKYR